jgi:short-chain Z-isoprenyl diphosphate synthase
VGARDLLYSVYGRQLSWKLARTPVEMRPRHVALMLDGNRRWARDAGFVDVNDGHRVGAAKIAHLLGWCDEAGVEVVTLWLLSTDNLQRPSAELETAAQDHR